MTDRQRLRISLLALRLGVFITLVPWVADKFLNPSHAIGVFEYFYGIGGVPDTAVYVLGALQALLVLAFVLGIARRWSYGLVLLMHAGSTFSSWRQYIDPYEGANLLFFAAWPMLAACLALYLLREHDRLLTIGNRPA